MIATDFYKTRSDGVNLFRTYSDTGYYIIRNDGLVFAEAIDVEDCPYTYTETEELIDVPAEQEPVEPEEPVEPVEPEEPVDEDVSAEEALAELLEVLES